MDSPVAGMRIWAPGPSSPTGTAVPCRPGLSPSSAASHAEAEGWAAARRKEYSAPTVHEARQPFILLIYDGTQLAPPTWPTPCFHSALKSLCPPEPAREFPLVKRTLCTYEDTYKTI